MSLSLHHRNPFDHLLMAQAQAEHALLRSGDGQRDRYSIKKIRCSGHKFPLEYSRVSVLSKIFIVASRQILPLVFSHSYSTFYLEVMPLYKRIIYCNWQFIMKLDLKSMRQMIALIV